GTIDGALAGMPHHFADRWIWVLMATLFVLTALAGFIPRSLHRLELIAAGEQSSFAPIVHVHAVATGSWLLLVLAQSLFVAIGLQRWHQTLGKVSLVVGPAVVISLIAITVHGFGSQMDDLTLGQLSDLLAFALFVQGKSILLFVLYFVCAPSMRLGNSHLDKRVVVLANGVLILAAFARMPWLSHIGLEWRYYENLWSAMIFAAMILFDAMRARAWLWVWLL